DVYDATLVDKSTGVTHVTQLLYNSETRVYYVYVRWGETEYILDGPHETVEEAKAAFQVSYETRFGVTWEKRETIVSEQWSYEVKTYEEIEEIEEVEEVVEESEVEIILAREQKQIVGETIVESVTEVKTTTTSEEHVAVEQINKETVTTEGEEIVKVVTTMTETGVVSEPVVSSESSWFRRIATGAGAVAAGALTQVDGVWKRAVQVVTTRKAHVDKVCPIAHTSFVYYDEDVYDAVLTDRRTGVTYITQLLFDSKAKAYYVYIRWGESEYKLDGPHDSIDTAKAAFQVSYYEQFGIVWTERRNTVSEEWMYEVKTYETFETYEEIEEIVEDYETSEVIAREQKVIVGEQTVSTHQSIASTHDDSVTRSVSEKVVFQEGSSSSSSELSHAQYDALAREESARRAASASSSSTTTFEEKKATFDLSTLPQLGNVGIDVETGASVGVVDFTSGTATRLRELPAHLRPRAWVSLHVGGWRNSPRELSGFLRVDDQLYGHFEEELPEELSLERLSQLGPHRT
ncbi:hypothetical protein BGW38_007538, partial [Lunasporangiospora selenospora]